MTCGRPESEGPTPAAGLQRPRTGCQPGEQCQSLTDKFLQPIAACKVTGKGAPNPISLYHFFSNADSALALHGFDQHPLCICDMCQCCAGGSCAYVLETDVTSESVKGRTRRGKRRRGRRAASSRRPTVYVCVSAVCVGALMQHRGVSRALCVRVCRVPCRDVSTPLCVLSHVVSSLVVPQPTPHPDPHAARRSPRSRLQCPERRASPAPDQAAPDPRDRTETRDRAARPDRRRRDESGEETRHLQVKRTWGTTTHRAAHVVCLFRLKRNAH